MHASFLLQTDGELLEAYIEFGTGGLHGCLSAEPHPVDIRRAHHFPVVSVNKAQDGWFHCPEIRKYPGVKCLGSVVVVVLMLIGVAMERRYNKGELKTLFFRRERAVGRHRASFTAGGAHPPPPGGPHVSIHLCRIPPNAHAGAAENGSRNRVFTGVGRCGSSCGMYVCTISE